jgi:hypothetical protein
VKHAWKTESARDVAYRSIVLEAKREQQAVSGGELGECLCKGELELVAAEACVWGVCFCRKPIRIDFVGNEILESSSCRSILLPISILAARASVALSKEIENEPAGNDHKPRRELYIRPGDVRP